MAKKSGHLPAKFEIKWVIDIDDPNDPRTKAAIRDLACALGRLAARHDLANAEAKGQVLHHGFRLSDASDKIQQSDDT